MEKITFRIPVILTIIQFPINVILWILCELGPFLVLLVYILMDVYVFAGTLSMEIFDILVYICVPATIVYIIVVHDKGKYPMPVKIKFFVKSWNYLPRRYIMKNVKCPNCGSEFKGWRKLEWFPIYLDDIALICGNCGKEFTPSIDTESKSFFTVYTLKEVKKSVKVNIDDIHLEKAVHGKGYTLYIKLTIKNSGKHKMWIFSPYVVTNKNKVHACVFDRIIEDKDSFEEGSPMEIPSRSTLAVTARTFDLEKIDQSLSKDEIPMKFFYRLTDEEGILYPEYSIEIPEKLRRKIGIEVQ